MKVYNFISIIFEAAMKNNKTEGFLLGILEEIVNLN